MEKEGKRLHGRPVILFSSYPGSERYQAESFLDAMCIAMHYGAPTYFLTFTSNPNWPEIIEDVKEFGPYAYTDKPSPNGVSKQKAQERCDLINRVCLLKFKSILDDLLKKEVLGKTLCYVAVIEFQKRGLPHMHLLLTVHPDYVPHCPESVDKVITAQFVDKLKYPNLYSLQCQHIIHGPCHPPEEDKPNTICACWDYQHKRCRHCFPKPMQEATTFAENHFAQYARPDNGRHFIGRGGFVIKNEWLAPHNLYLLQRYNCHICVELCTDVMAYKYVFKYVFKGYDSAHMILKTHGEGYVYDEIERHLDFRYLTATEAAWRIFGFWLQKKSHSVIRLALHEEGKHTVYYNSDEPEPPSPEDTFDTHLLAYFAICRKHVRKGDWIEPLGSSRRIPNPNRLLYTEIPQHFRWDRTKHKWRRRLISKIGLGRLPFISPAKGELFHLRTLLCHVRGAKHWNDLKTIYGEQYPTFKAACIALGLQRDDREANLTLAEAVQFQMPRQLRQLFATLLTYNTPADPHALWERYKHQLSQDFTNPKRKHPFTPAQAEQLTFWLINKICIQQNSDIDLEQLLEVQYEPLPFTLDYYSTNRPPDLAK
jgi:hypothetical protein